MSLLRFEGRIVEVGTGVRGVRVEREDDGGERFLPRVARLPVTEAEVQLCGAAIDEPVLVTVSRLKEGDEETARWLRLGAVLRAAQAFFGSRNTPGAGDNLQRLTEATAALKPGDIP